MKTKMLILTCIAINFFCVPTLHAQEKKFKKEKSYTKTYVISAVDNISLDNQYGETKLITWDKNEIKVEISITAMSDDESEAQKNLERVSISDEKNNYGVSFKTIIADGSSNNALGVNFTNEAMRINYTVYLPLNNPLTIKQQYGALLIPDYTGEVNLESNFGSLTTGKLAKPKKIKANSSSVRIGELNSGTLELLYTNATISRSGGDVNASLNYSTVQLNIGNNIHKLEVNNNYTNLYLDLDKNLSASYNILNNLGSFTNKSDFTINANQENNLDNANKFFGRSGKGDALININSSFGFVVAGHNLRMNMSSMR